MMPSTESVGAIVGVLGPDAVAFSLDLHVDATGLLMAGALPLSSAQQDALERLWTLTRGVQTRAAESGLTVDRVLQNLGVQQPHPLHEVRAIAGGEGLRVSHDDPVIDALQTLLVDVYPAIAIGRHYARAPWRFPGGFYLAPSSELSRVLESRLLEDPALTRLFPEPGPNAFETVSWVETSTGRGVSLQLELMPELLLEKADVLARLKGDREFAGLLDAAVEVIVTLRTLALGESVATFMRVGFNHIGFESQFDLELPWGRLLPYNDRFGEFFPSALVPPPAPNGFFGVILETEVDYRIRVEGRNAPENEDSLSWSYPYQLELAKRIEDTRLVISLALDRVPPAAAVQSWTLTADLLIPGGGLTWRADRWGWSQHDYQLAQTEGVAVEEWARRVSSVDDAPVAIARRRLLSALVDRSDPIDGLIDAVIGWENLFGGDRGELVLRITTALACLLEVDANDRRELRKKAAKVYDARSKVVHGARHLSAPDAIARRNEAVEYLTKALRVLYRDRPDLIAAKDRAITLILGG